MHAHHQADDHEHGRQQERHTPAPAHHRLGIVERLQQEERAVGQEEADRRAQLRERAVQRALVLRRVLGGDQRRARPFAAQTDALHEAAQAQDHNRQQTDLLVGRQASDEERGHAHRHQGDDQRLLAAETVTEVAEDQRADRAGDERDRERDQAEQQRDGRVGGVREEHGREVVRRGGAVGVEVIEFDGRADHRGGDHGFDRIAGGGRELACGRGVVSRGIDCCHGIPSLSFSGTFVPRCGCGPLRCVALWGATKRTPRLTQGPEQR